MMRLTHYTMNKPIKSSLLWCMMALSAGCGGNQKYIQKLDSSNISVRYDAVCYLGREEEKAAVPKLLELLAPSQPAMIRLASTQALGFIKEKSAVTGLLGLLNDPDTGLRKAACDALGQIHDPQAVKPLINLLTQPEVNIVAIWALGEIGGDEAVPALNGLLESPDPYVKYNAFRALKKLEDKK
jgi:HEAT repeat protein